MSDLLFPFLDVFREPHLEALFLDASIEVHDLYLSPH
jgi:hypothetical protein